MISIKNLIAAWRFSENGTFIEFIRNLDHIEFEENEHKIQKILKRELLFNSGIINALFAFNRTFSDLVIKKLEFAPEYNFSYAQKYVFIFTSIRLDFKGLYTQRFINKWIKDSHNIFKLTVDGSKMLFDDIFSLFTGNEILDFNFLNSEVRRYILEDYDKLNNSIVAFDCSADSDMLFGRLIISELQKFYSLLNFFGKSHQLKIKWPSNPDTIMYLKFTGTEFRNDLEVIIDNRMEDFQDMRVYSSNSIVFFIKRIEFLKLCQEISDRYNIISAIQYRARELLTLIEQPDSIIESESTTNQKMAINNQNEEQTKKQINTQIKEQINEFINQCREFTKIRFRNKAAFETPTISEKLQHIIETDIDYRPFVKYAVEKIRNFNMLEYIEELTDQSLKDDTEVQNLRYLILCINSRSSFEIIMCQIENIINLLDTDNSFVLK